MRRLALAVLLLAFIVTAAWAVEEGGQMRKDDNHSPLLHPAYHAKNNVLDLYIGETYSDNWKYQYQNGVWGEACYAEYYYLWYNGSIHRSDGFTVTDYFGTSQNDPDTQATTRSGDI